MKDFFKKMLNIYTKYSILFAEIFCLFSSILCILGYGRESFIGAVVALIFLLI